MTAFFNHAQLSPVARLSVAYVAVNNHLDGFALRRFALAADNFADQAFLACGSFLEHLLESFSVQLSGPLRALYYHFSGLQSQASVGARNGKTHYLTIGQAPLLCQALASSWTVFAQWRRQAPGAGRLLVHV